MATITFRPPPQVAEELDRLVRSGRYADLPSAITEAVTLLLQREKASRAVARIRNIHHRLHGWDADLTQAVVTSHEDEE